MKFDVVIPQVGESITEVVIAQWLKADGDFVEADELICEIESDKASFEIPAEKSGVLAQKAKEGDTVAVGGSIATIDTEATNQSSDSQKDSVPESKPQQSNDKSLTAEKETPPPPASKGTNASGKKFDLKVPQVGESISEVTIAAWLKPDGATVAAGDLVAEIESDKASFEIPTENAGILKHRVAEGETVQIGVVIAEVSGSGEQRSAAATDSKEKSDPAAAAEKPENVGTKTAPNQQEGHGSKTRITPLAKHILDDAGLQATTVEGSGPGGTITRDDALYAVRRTRENGAPKESSTMPSKATQSPANDSLKGKRGERREKLSSLRRTIARRLVTVKNETAMLTTFNEVDMSEVKNLRSAYKESFKEKHGVGLGFMSFFTRAVCLALQEWQAVNASIDDNYIIYHDYCDISIAVSTPKGLVVPVIRNAESLSMAGIEKEVVNLATKARDGKLTIDEMTGGTFTLTNGGVFGSLMSTPIINAPQSAILGMHKIEDRPVAIGGQVVIRPMMYLALSYDHRIIDGRESVSFLVRVKELLENPSRMLLEI